MSEKDQLGLVQMFWGDGKGKTTAALGMALRALGHGLRVHLIQFFKGGSKSNFQEYGELIALRRFERFSVEQFGVSGWIVSEPTEEQRQVSREALAAAVLAASSGKYNMVILDESLYAVSFGAISAAELLAVIKDKAPATELVLTGSHQRLPEIEAAADLVTEIKKVKHPYDRGITARKGVDY